MDTDEDRPPFFRTWKGMYALVLGTLLGEVIVFSIVAWIYR
jgi:hypothetical protein